MVTGQVRSRLPGEWETREVIAVPVLKWGRERNNGESILDSHALALIFGVFNTCTIIQDSPQLVSIGFP